MDCKRQGLHQRIPAYFTQLAIHALPSGRDGKGALPYFTTTFRPLTI